MTDTAPFALSSAAFKLLQMVKNEETCMIIDETSESSIVVISRIKNISLSLGRFSRDHLYELENHTFVKMIPPKTATQRLKWTITPLGRQWLSSTDKAGGNAFLAQHTELVSRQVRTEEGSQTVLTDSKESPLAWMIRRKDKNGMPLIDAASFEAGEKLRRELNRAQILPNISLSWDKVGSNPSFFDPASSSDALISARQRVRRTLKAVGPDFADILIDLCGFLKSIDRIERERDWPIRSGKVAIRLALSRLADHYGLRSEATGPARARSIQVWRELGIQTGL
jgi:hypothetical protein